MSNFTAWLAVHMALLPNGKVLAYDSMGDNATESYPVQDHTRATVWDPATGSQTPVNVRVDPEKCQSHGQCYALAPELFVADDQSRHMVHDGAAESELRAHAVRSGMLRLRDQYARATWGGAVTPIVRVIGAVREPELALVSTASMNDYPVPEADIAASALGPLEVRVAGQRVPRWASLKARVVFQYLLVHQDRPTRRDVLMAQREMAFWNPFYFEFKRLAYEAVGAG